MPTPLDATLTYPSHQIDSGNTILGEFVGSQELEARELAKRTALLAAAVNGDEMAKLMVRKVLRLSGWYSREHGGDVIGSLSEVAREREGMAA